MVKVIEVKDWGNITHRKTKSHDLFYINVVYTDVLYKIAEKLNLKFIFKKNMICKSNLFRQKSGDRNI